MSTTHELDAIMAIDSAEQFRALLAGYPPETRESHVFAKCEHTLVFSRHHWLMYDGDYRVRADLRELLGAVRSRGPGDWDAAQCVLVLVLYALSLAGVGLEQLLDEVGVKPLRDVLEHRLLSYLDALGQPRGTAEALPLLALAMRVRELRPQVEAQYHRYSIIDGKAWYREEGLIPKSSVDATLLPPSLAVQLARDWDPAAGHAAEETLRQITRREVARAGESVEVLRAIMRAAVADPRLRVDHATITCARGDMLDRVTDMTGSEDFFSETVLRDRLDLSGYAEQIGHDSAERLTRTTKARMLKLKRGAVRNYFQPGCLQGQWVEKAADYMIFRNEDSHYRGHQSIGCSTGGRAAYSVRYRRDDRDGELPPMMGDFRVVRMSHDPAETFTGADLVHVVEYSRWVHAVIEETFRCEGVVAHRAAGGVTAGTGRGGASDFDV